MVDTIDRINQKRLGWALLLSLLIHILLLLLFSEWDSLNLFPEGKGESPVREIQFELVETPSASERPPEESDLVSDKQSIARDMNRNLPEGDDPFSEGITDVRRLESALRPETARDVEKHSPESDEMRTTPFEQDPLLENPSPVHRREAFSRDRLLADRSAPSQPASPATGAVYSQERESAPEFGGISLNTYAWEYAPYLLELKRRIEKNIYPPPIFTRMGIGGKNVLRFRIYPDGRLEGPELLGSEGEKSLIQTSENAIRFSAPFPGLPEDFPKEFLEVTARFDYMIVNRP